MDQPIKYTRNKIDASEIKKGVVFRLTADMTGLELGVDDESHFMAGSVFLAREAAKPGRDGMTEVVGVFVEGNFHNGDFQLTPEQFREWVDNHDFNLNSVQVRFADPGNRVEVIKMEDAIVLMNKASNETRNLEGLISWVVPVQFKFEGDTILELKGLVLDEAKRKAIISIITAHSEDNQEKLNKTWGFASTIEKGLGIAILFWGPPGTGKTKCAEIMAEELGLKLTIVGPDMIWSSEPGGAERTIKEIFAKADPKATLLLFDECDVLLCDRKHTGVILSASTNTLLQSMERYKGITVFTTNRAPVLDPAVERRLQLKLEFDKPPYELQVRIWQTLVPPQCPLEDDVCFKTLAKYDLPGGHIKNVILNAARRAIYEKAEKVRMDHFMSSVKDELEGMAAFNQDDDTPVPYGAAGAAKMVMESGGKIVRKIERRPGLGS